MNWTTIIWSMIASASLAIAGVYFVVWLRQRESRAYLMFVFLAIGTAATAAAELWMMQSTTIDEFGTALRWFHVPICMAIFAYTGLVYYLMSSSRLWLGLTACGLRVVTVIINFIQDPNINYSEITHLERVPLFGEPITLVTGVPNPWMLVAQLSLLILIIYSLDAAVNSWRRSRDVFTFALGSVLSLLVIGGSLQAVLGFWEIFQIPVFVTPFFLGVTVMMGIELSLGMLRASKMEQETAQQKMQLAHLSRAAALSELSGSVAHELNQPLGIILSNAEAAQMLLENDDPDVAEIKEIVGDIISADRRAADVITRLRALLKQSEPDFESVELNSAIEETLSLLRGELITHGVQFELEAGENLPPVRADRILLVQVMLNLITNAVDAVAENPPGQRRVKVTTAENGDSVEATVLDNGRGLPDDPMQVFNPFYTTKASGLGMGLAIVQSIVAAHDGRIWADSNAIGKTNFHVLLPRAMEAT